MHTVASHKGVITDEVGRRYECGSVSIFTSGITSDNSGIYSVRTAFGARGLSSWCVTIQVAVIDG